MSLLHPHRRGFTLLELVVVIVVLAVLAAIAVPTFGRVIDRSHDEAAATSLSAFAREVQSLAAFEQSGFTTEHFTDAAFDMSAIAAPGVVAAGVEVRGGVERLGNVKAKPSGSDALAVLSYSTLPDASRAAVAAISASGSCVAVRFDATLVSAVPMPEDEDLCTGYNALYNDTAEGVEPGDDPAAPSNLPPAKVEGLSGKGAGGKATLSWGTVPGASTYRVREGEKVVATSSTPSASVDQAYGSTVSYTVEAVNQKGAGPRSNAVPVTHVPAAPVISDVKMVAGEAEITWSPVEGVTVYNVYRDGSDTVAASTVSSVTKTSVPVGAGQSAVFVVKAGNSAGLSEGSAPRGVTATPAAPENVTATISGLDVTVSWDGVEGATGYDVYDSVTDLIVVSVVGETTAFDTLAAGESRSYVVRSKNGAGASEGSSPSNTVSAAPASPAGLTGIHEDGKAVLSWQAAPGATSYTLYREGTTAAVATTTTLTASVAQAEGTTATYRLVASNKGGPGAPSTAVTITAIPAAPQNVDVEMSAPSVATVSWDRVPGATLYEVFRAGDPATSAGIVTADELSLDVPLASGQSATFFVKAGNSGGLSAASQTVGVTAVPAAPTNVTATLSGGTVTLTWTGSTGATAYDVYYSSGTVAKLAVTGTTTTIPLAEGASATFVVKATNTGGASEGSTPSNTVTRAPAAPSNVTATMTSATVATVSWTAPSGATSYEVARDGVWKAVTGTTTTYTLAAGETESFTVRALNTGGTGPASAAVSVTAVPAAPSGVAVRMVGNDAEVSWNQVAGATSYHVYRDSSSTAAAIEPGTSTKTLIPLNPGQSATFFVKAGNSGGLSAASQTVGVTAVPAAPTNVTATLSGGTVTLTWTGSTGATAYDVYYSSGTVAKLAVTGTTTTIPLAEGASATFVVKATNTGGASEGSTPSNTVTRAPAAPSNVSVTFEGTTAVVSFTENIASGVSYTAKAYPAVSAPEATPPSKAGTKSPLRITGLQYDQRYTFTVTAENSAGSATSDSVEARPRIDLATASWGTAPSTVSAHYVGASGSDRNGTIFVAGGYDGVAHTKVAERYDGGSWSRIADLPQTMYLNAGAIDPQGRLYSIGGEANQVAAPSTFVYRYDPSLNRWDTLAPLPTALRLAAAASDSNGNIYVTGGGTPTASEVRTTYRYNPSSNAWTQVASMNAVRQGHSMELGPDGKLYALGGYANSTYLSSVERYDPATNTWTTVASMGTARQVFSTQVGSDGKIYAMGGTNGTNLASVERYDPATNTWSAGPSMPVARLGSATGTDTAGRIHVISGFSEGAFNRTTVRLG